MLTFNKAFRRVLFYVLGFSLALALYSYWLIELIVAQLPLDRDFYLLTFAFIILFGAQFIVIITYIRRPKRILEVKEDVLYVGITRKKTVAVHINEVTGFGNFRNTLTISLKNNKMYVVRFINEPALAQQQLGDYLTNYIQANEEKYYADFAVKSEETK